MLLCEGRYVNHYALFNVIVIAFVRSEHNDSVAVGFPRHIEGHSRIPKLFSAGGGGAFLRTTEE